ncbi:hypothetical protein ScPMuIL_015944 [Solemya velum]
MAAQSPSSNWRKQGNEIYVTATENFSPVVRKERLNKAINLYYRALTSSGGDDETASAAKNLSLALWRMANLHFMMGRVQDAVRLFVESLKNFGKSLTSAEGCKQQSWKDELTVSLESCYADVVHLLESMELRDRIAAMRDVIENMPSDSIRASCFLNLARYHFHFGIISLGKGDHKACLFQMCECYFPLNEASRLGGMMNEIPREVELLEQDVFMHQCTAESIQARLTGDGLLVHVLRDEENLNVDMVWEVIDWYKKSVLQTREVTEVEQEAISLARIGKVYGKILKMKEKSKEYLMRAVQLALSMHPRTFNNDEWYKECTQHLEQYQQEVIEEEESKAKKERDEILKELEKEMSLLKVHDNDLDIDFLKFVYKEFPPKNKKHFLGEIPKVLEREERKKMLQKSVVHYHPDRAKAEDGKKWKALTEEITKRLTRRYECMK